VASKCTAILYDKPDGSVPASEFMKSLDEKMRAKLARSISALENTGSALREPYSKPLGDGIFELRAQIGNNISRVLFFFMIGNRAIITHGFVKKTEKTPISEIVRAKKYRTEYLNRKENKIYVV